VTGGGGQLQSGHSESKASSAPKGAEGPEDGASAEEKLQTQLDELIDNLTEKRTETRVRALQQLQNHFANNILTDYLATRAETVMDALFRKCFSTIPERELAMHLAALLFIQEGERRADMFVSFQERLLATLLDTTVDADTRAACAFYGGFVVFLFGDAIDHCRP